MSWKIKLITDIPKKLYYGLKKVHRFDKEDVEIHKKKTFKKCNESDLIYSNKYSFYKYYDINEFNGCSFKPKYNDLVLFNQDLN